jgi:hypothetical protein
MRLFTRWCVVRIQSWGLSVDEPRFVAREQVGMEQVATKMPLLRSLGNIFPMFLQRCRTYGALNERVNWQHFLPRQSRPSMCYPSSRFSCYLSPRFISLMTFIPGRRDSDWVRLFRGGASCESSRRCFLNHVTQRREGAEGENPRPKPACATSLSLNACSTNRSAFWLVSTRFLLPITARMAN